MFVISVELFMPKYVPTFTTSLGPFILVKVIHVQLADEGGEVVVPVVMGKHLLAE